MSSAPDALPDLLSYLVKVALFKDLSPGDLADVARQARQADFPEGSFLFVQGDPSVACYVLTAGRVRLSQVTPEGQQVIMRFIGPGEGFGVGAVLSQTTYPSSAEAVEPCHALMWDGATMSELMTRHPRIALNTVALLVRQFHELQARYRELATERVERRIARALIRLARQVGRKTPEGLLIDQALSRQDLAELTGTTLYTVSRILSRWEEQGLVTAGRESVLIRFPHGLVAIAEDLPKKDEGLR